MPTTVDIPDVGTVEFPDAMSETEISQASEALWKKASGEKEARRAQAVDAAAAAGGTVAQVADVFGHLNYAGDVARGAAVDVMAGNVLPKIGRAMPNLKNTAAAFRGEILPDEETLTPVQLGLADAAEMTPKVAAGMAAGGAGMAAGGAGMAPSAAFGGVMGLTTFRETGDPIEAGKATITGALIPGVGELGRREAAKGLMAAVEKGLLSADRTKVHKAIEALGAQGAIQAFMEGLNVPQYLALEPEQRKEMFIRNLAANTAFLALDVPAVVSKGPSQTQQGLSPAAQVGHLVEKLVNDPVALEAMREKIDSEAVAALDPSRAQERAPRITNEAPVVELTPKAVTPTVLESGAETITGPDEQQGSAMPAELPSSPSLTPSRARPKPPTPKDRPWDIIDEIAANVGKFDPALLRQAYPDWKPEGAVRQILRKGGIGADQALNAVTYETGASYGMMQGTGLMEFGEALNHAARARKAAREQVRKEKGILDLEAKQFGQFQSKVIEGQRPKKEQGKVERVPVFNLVEGDTFEVQGNKFRVREIEFDDDGYMTSVTVADGPKFGTQTIAGEEFIHFDKGTLDASKRPPVSTDWLPPNEMTTVKAPKLGSGEQQGDLISSTQREDFKLMAEEGIDVQKQQKMQQEQQRAAAEAKAIQDQQQVQMFAGADSSALATVEKATLPRQIDSDVTVPDPATGQPVALADVRTYLAEALDIPVRLGVRVKGGLRRALGLYRVRPETIRMKMLNDIPTLAHEVGHYLHYLLFPGGRPRTASAFANKFDAELMALGAVTSGPRYSPHQVRKEGVAEFVREWMTDPSVARAKAPNFTAFFEGELQVKYPEVWKIVSNAQRMVGEYIKQPAQMKVRSMINMTPEDASIPMRQRLEKLYNNWVNDLEPINRALAKLQAFGLKPGLAKRVADYAVNYIGGWRGKVEHSLRYAQVDLKGNVVGPGLKQILSGVESLNDFRDYLVAKRALEKNAQGKETGIDSRDARDVVNLLGAKYESKRRELLKFQKNNLLLLQDAGLISHEQVRRMERMNHDYVPFFRVQENIASGGDRKGEGFVNLGQGVHAFKGSDRQIVDPLESIVKNSYTFRDLAERNQIARLFVGAVDSTQGGGRVAEEIAKRVKPVEVHDKEVRDALEAAGIDPKLLDEIEMDLSFKIWRAAKQNSAADGTFTVWKNGEEQRYQLSDPELYRALMLADATDAAIFAKFPAVSTLRQVTRVLRAGATLTLEFIGRNPFRDQVTAGVYSKYGFVPFFDGFRGILSAVGKDHWYQDWLKAGGRYADFVSMDRANLQETLAQVIDEPSMLRRALNLADPRNVVRNLQAASELMESATRIAEFRRAKEAGASDVEAANASKEVTLNFSRGGFKGKALNQLIAFWNAQVQDIDKFARAHQERPFATTAKAFAYISLPSIITWYLGKDDPEIQKLPEWRKNLFWNLNLGSFARKAGEQGDFILSVPKPFLLGQIYGSSIERGLDYITGRDPNGVDKWFKQLLQAQPITLNNILPTALKPIVETAANHSLFRGQPLEPRNTQGLPPSERTTPNTSLVARTIAKMVPEELELSPIKIDNLVRGYLGGLGKYGTDAIDWLAYKLELGDVPEAPAKDLWERPFFRAFRQSPYEASAFVERFYNGIERAEQRLQVLRSAPEIMTTEDLQKQFQVNGADYAWYLAGGGRNMKALREAQEGMAAVAKAMRLIQNSRTLSAGEKREQLLELSRQRDAIAEGAYGLLSPADRQKVY